MNKRVALAGISAVALSLTACGGGIGGSSADGDSDTFTIGFVTTKTGALAGFGEANDYVIGSMKSYFKDHPLSAGGKDYKVKVVVVDSQSDSSRAGQVASDLINKDNVDLVVASATPDVDNPVSEQCEANSVPCLTTVSPWQPYAIRSGSEPAQLKYSHHFFWGLEDVAQVYSNIWKQVPNNGKAAGLFPNDPDGQAWSANFPALTKDSGVTIDNPGLYTNGTKDFSAQIAKFKGADIVMGVPTPPDFTTFWTQAEQQGLKPKVATIGKALLFPSAVESVGDAGNNLSTEVWWHPTEPFSSSLTGKSAQQLADDYEKDTGKQWTQPLGYAEAIFEVAAAALDKAGSTDPEKLNAAFTGLQVKTIVGDLTWGAEGLPPYVAKAPLLGGQWRLTDGGKHKYELVVVDNSESPDTPLGGKVEPLN